MITVTARGSAARRTASAAVAWPILATGAPSARSAWGRGSRPMTPSEIGAQKAIDAAGAQAARLHFQQIRELPRWRQWLLRRISPPYPCVQAQLPPGPIQVTTPLEVPPGVAVIGAHIDPVPGNWP